MTEILTESFCERCGTRYTFESAAPRRSRIGRVRTLGKGMKNFVLSDDSSFSEAMAEARSEQELAAVAHQLDAFHQTFNFCLTCRQYTCGDCWNEADGRCLTCAPIPGMEEPRLAPPALAEIPAYEPDAEAPATDGIDEAWPDVDLSAGRLSRALGLDEAEAEATLEAGTPDDGLAEQLDVASLTAGTVAATEPAQVGWDPAPVAGLAPGQSLEDAIAAYEARLEADDATASPAEVAVVPEPDAGTDGAGDPVAAAEDGAIRPAVSTASLVPALEDEVRETAPEPVAAEAALEPEPEPVAAEREVQAAPETPPETAPEPTPEPVSEPAPVPVAAEPARVDVVPQPVWPQPTPTLDSPSAPAPDQPLAPANPWLTVAPEDGDSPEWPAAPAWPVAPTNRDLPATLAGRPLLPLNDASGIWAASAREVLTGAATAPTQQAAAAPAPTAQPCVSCGLSLSANARFCRRCGTRQG
ncbi:MAG TPA: hypothetical protein VGK16_05345 [Candidatus Limnocylindrales bacterium]